MSSTGLSFTGFNFIQYASKLGAHKIVCADPMLMLDAFKAMKIDWLDSAGVAFYKYMSNDPKLAYVIEIEKIDVIVDFMVEDVQYSAEAQDRIAAEKIAENLLGAYNLLELSKKYGLRLHIAGNTAVYRQDRGRRDDRQTVKTIR